MIRAETSTSPAALPVARRLLMMMMIMLPEQNIHFHFINDQSLCLRACTCAVGVDAVPMYARPLRFRWAQLSPLSPMKRVNIYGVCCPRAPQPAWTESMAAAFPLPNGTLLGWSPQTSGQLSVKWNLSSFRSARRALVIPSRCPRHPARSSHTA